MNMASFVIHHIAAERFLAILAEKYGITLSKEEQDEFFMANLIPDSSKLRSIPKDAPAEERKAHSKKVQEEKVVTHFRSEDDKNLSIQVPDLEKYTDKYEKRLGTNLSFLGYLFHLFTDKSFFGELSPNAFVALDENGNPTIYNSETCSMLVKKNGKIFTISEFWDKKSPISLYQDYTTMNKILLEHYGSTFDIDRFEEAATSFQNPGIDEVDFGNINAVLNKTKGFIQESYAAEDSTLNIFDEQQVIDFIDENANKFISQY